MFLGLALKHDRYAAMWRGKNASRVEWLHANSLHFAASELVRGMNIEIALAQREAPQALPLRERTTIVMYRHQASLTAADNAAGTLTTICDPAASGWSSRLS
jgi:hypothetical protein